MDVGTSMMDETNSLVREAIVQSADGICDLSRALRTDRTIRAIRNDLELAAERLRRASEAVLAASLSLISPEERKEMVKEWPVPQ